MSHESEAPNGDVDAQLNELLRAVSDLRSKCLIRSAYRATLEAKRLAKAERRLLPYLMANFYVMNLSQDLFEHEAGREAAIENIALLESPDRARAFQGDYDEGRYDHTVHWMSACSYDNLATATGMLQGYNSTGMQACIADGIQVCRRTGKLECVACFREYATEVHRAADDLAMALHQATTNANAKPPADGGNDRRFIGAYDRSRLLLLAGQLEAAHESAARSMGLSESYHTPLRARRMARNLLRQAGHLAGNAEWVEAGTDPAADRTPRGEDPMQDLRDDLAEALAEANRGEVPAAIARLATWDEQLSRSKCLHWWFETRLHLVALHRLAGKADRAAPLARPLEAKARQANDFLTLRRLDRMLSSTGALPPSPFPAVGPLTTGRYAAPTPAPDAAPPSPTAPAAKEESEAPKAEQGPLQGVVVSLVEQLNGDLRAAAEADRAPDIGPIVEAVLAIPPERVTHVGDAASLLHLLAFVARGPVPHERVWAWAGAVAERHPTEAAVVALRAQLGDVLRSAEGSPVAEAIQPAELEALFRRAMDLDPNWAEGFAKAGVFFLRNGNDVEAERCLARAFRLDRSNEHVASDLADLYAASDRPGDALAVLDMCLRQGTESPDLLWKAGVRAVGLERHESAVTYLDRLEAIEPGRPWVQYYRALALLALNRPAEAMEAADKEAERTGRADALHVQSIRAAAAAQLDRPGEVRRHLDASLAIALRTIEDLTPVGIRLCHARMWTAALTLPADDPVRRRVTDRLLRSGLTPDAIWAYYRTGPGVASAEPVKGLNHYVIDLRQPLGQDWVGSDDCPPGQEGWTAYLVRYGVLAPSEDEARQTVLEWQSRSAARPAEIINVEQDGGPDPDRPGVTWRTPPAEPE
jgi:tetratricopeptide (TPR) repeat protein